jgi:hypothetical protein
MHLGNNEEWQGQTKENNIWDFCELANLLLQKVNNNWLSVVMWSVSLIIGGMRYLGSLEIKCPKCISRIVHEQNVVYGTRFMKA